MEAMMRLLKKLGIWVRRDTFRSELEEEMAFHRSLAAEELVEGGASPGEAQRAARRRFGNETKLREQSHEMVEFRLESVLHDLRFALRQLRKNPGFACTAITVLTLGIASSLAIFAFVDAALVKPLPYRDASRLVGAYEHLSVCPKCNLSYEDFLDWRRENKVFQSFDAWGFASYLWRAPAGVQPVLGVRVSGGFFQTLGVTPVLGRDFTDYDDSAGAPRTVLLSYGAWQRRFGGRAEVLGRSVILDDTAYVVVGVLPQDFQFAPRGGAEFWTTLHDPNSCEKRRSCHNLFAIGRLKDGVSVETASADMKAIAAQLEREYPNSNLGQGALVIPLSEAIVGDLRPILLVLLGGAGLLLLIACVNVASLLLVRGESRKREMALRSALGASRSRLVRQFVTEGLVLVGVGMVSGLAAAYWAIHLMLKLIPREVLADMPYLEGIGLNGRVLVFCLLISLAAAVVFSVTPALRLPVSKLREDLTEGGRSAAGTTWRRFGANLVALELAIAMVLLVGAGLLGKSFYRLLHVELNFEPEHLATLEIAAPDVNYGKDEQAIALSKELRRRIGSMPGVISVSHTSLVPVTCNCNTTWFRVLGHPYHGEHNDAPQREVSAEYFKTIEARLIRGRFFTEADDASKTPLIMINQALAKQYFPGEDPIGKMIGNTDLAPKSMKQVIGVVDDVREGSLEQEIRPAVYYPFNQNAEDSLMLVVRTEQDPKTLLPALVAAVHAIDPGIGVKNEATMTQLINDSQSAYLHRSSAWLVGAFAGLALVLGVVGLYGVIAYSVSQRTREIGVRMALGAPRGSVYRMVLGEAGSLIGLGIGAGLVCSLAAGMLMRKLLFGVQAWDAATLIGVALVLGVSALFGSYWPARRAASIHPVEALRAE